MTHKPRKDAMLNISTRITARNYGRRYYTLAMAQRIIDDPQDTLRKRAQRRHAKPRYTADGHVKYQLKAMLPPQEISALAIVQAVEHAEMERNLEELMPHLRRILNENN